MASRARVCVGFGGARNQPSATLNLCFQRIATNKKVRVVLVLVSVWCPPNGRSLSLSTGRMSSLPSQPHTYREPAGLVWSSVTKRSVAVSSDRLCRHFNDDGGGFLFAPRQPMRLDGERVSIGFTVYVLGELVDVVVTNKHDAR